MWRKVYRPHLYVQRPELERRAWVSGMRLYQGEGAHQVVELTVMHTYNPAMPSQRWRTPAGSVWPENTPVHLRYGWWADDSADWYGYVASSRVLASESDPRYGHAVQVPVVYTLTGVSMPMQSRRSRTWSRTTSSAIARRIAAWHNLQPRIDTSSVLLDQSVQAASDWQYLADLADRIGYRLYLDNSTLWFVRRSTAMPSPDGSVPAFTQRKAPGVIDSLRDFSGVLGDTDPAGGLRARREAVAYNPTSGTLVSASYAQERTTALGQPVPPMLTSQYTTRPAGSYAQAQRLLDADAELLWVEAKAVVNGDPRLKPGALLELRGDGIGEAHQGRWMVRSAVHTIEVNQLYPQKSAYTVSVVVGRNNATGLELGVQRQPARSAPTVLVSGRWRSAYTGGAA